jgi:hypothetical protein
MIVPTNMNTKLFFVAIAIVAAFGTSAAIVGFGSVIPVVAQENMTMTMDDNMTMGNMTGGNMTMGDNMTMGG